MKFLPPNFRLLGLLLLLVIFNLSSCKKHDEKVNPPEIKENNPLVISDKVIEIQETDITSSAEEIQSGTIVVSNAKMLDSIKVGNVLVNSVEQGFLVEVTSKEGDKLTVIPASLDMVYNSGNMHFSSNDNNPNQKVAAYGLNVNLDEQLYSDNSVTVGFKGNLNFSPSVEGDIDFDDKTFFVRMNETPLQLSGELQIASNGDDINVGFEHKLWEGQVTRLIPGTLIFATYKFSLIDKISITGEGKLNNGVSIGGKSLTLSCTENASVSASISYNNGWNKSFNYTRTTNGFNWGGPYQVSLNVKHELVPCLEVLFYSSVGPSFKVIPYNNFKFDVYADNQDKVNWHHTTDFGVDGSVGVTQKIFKGIDAEYTLSLKDPVIIYEAPAKIKIESGNDQEATEGVQLEKPVTVRVQDFFDNEIAGAAVYFEVINGNGTISTPVAFSNSSGLASTNVTVGTGTDTLKIRASIKSADSDFKILKSVIFKTKPSTAGKFVTTAATGWRLTGIKDSDACHKWETVYRVDNAILSVTPDGSNYKVKHISSKYSRGRADSNFCAKTYSYIFEESFDCVTQNEVTSSGSNFSISTGCGTIIGNIEGNTIYGTYNVLGIEHYINLNKQ